MKIVKSVMLVMGMSAIVFSGNVANASLCVQYNINGWSHYSGNLPASYVDGSNSLVSASSLSPTNGLYIPGNSNMGGNGKFWFAGWQGDGSNPASAPAIQFSITAGQDISLGAMSYSWFSGNWSDHWFGPNHLVVWASTDNWTTYQQIRVHPIGCSYPDSDGSNYCIDDLSSLGVLHAGETASIRFVGCYGGDAAGFVHEFPDQQDLFVNITPVPEPATLLLLGLGGLFLRKRK